MTEAGKAERLARENAELRRRITELETAAAANANAAALLQSVLAAMPGYVTHADSQLRIRYLNRYQPGFDPAEVIGRSVFDYLDPAHHALAREVIERTRRTGEPGWFEARGRGAHGTPAVYETHVAAVSEPDGSIGVCMIGLEVTAQRRSEQALRESREQLRVAIEMMPLGLWSWDVPGNLIVWDAGMRRLHGTDDLPQNLEQYAERFVHVDDRERTVARVERMMASGVWESRPYRIIRADGSVRWILTTGSVIKEDGATQRLVGASLDITEQRAIEEQLRQAQKMEAIGGLTAGIAHNFNNMLTVIMPTLDLAARLVPKEREGQLRDAAHAAKRASELVRQLMTFAGQDRLGEREACEIAKLVEAAVAICRTSFEREITLRTEYQGDATVVCNPGQIEQVLVNLLFNARDAVRDAAAGRRNVTVRLRTQAGTLPPLAPGGAERPCVAIEVSDDGIGMNEEVQARAFEPFFTTKGVGRGTGLGLTTSYAIVRDHQGQLGCESQPSAGTTFTLKLPIATEPLPALRNLPEEPAARGLCLLLVDDDQAVRGAISELLCDGGLRVHTAASGAEALSQLVAEPEVDVVLLDRSMPDAPGETFVPRIREIAPRARILMFSGQNIDASIAAIVDGVVQKPVRGRELLAAVAKAAGESARRGR